ncbi:MAG: zinc-binding dehydrogenase [Alphaproteobacteria bacterium]|nr:zinc-binding dehydrogenase [Alphaproteobacteria bacterium]
MQAAEINEYGTAQNVIKIIEDAAIGKPDEKQILVRVFATSVNPIDCAIRSGYGQDFFKSKGGAEFPIRLGRDIAGYVEAVGGKVTAFKVGDEVYAAVLKGATAEYALVDEADAALKPQCLNFIEAASLPYVALTTWSALVGHVGLNRDNTKGKRIIIPRGAGGVGSFAIQLMKAWGAEVATICSTRNVELVRGLGADVVVDYTKADFSKILYDYDVAFDTAFDTEENLLNSLKKNSAASYVSIVSPKIQMVDEFGLEKGLEKVAKFYEERVAEQKKMGRDYYWSFMEPNGQALSEIASLVDEGKIKPVIDRVYPMKDIVAAHEFCETKQAQGKIIIQIAT